MGRGEEDVRARMDVRAHRLRAHACARCVHACAQCVHGMMHAGACLPNYLRPMLPWKGLGAAAASCLSGRSLRVARMLAFARPHQRHQRPLQSHCTSLGSAWCQRRQHAAHPTRCARTHELHTSCSHWVWTFTRSCCSPASTAHNIHVPPSSTHLPTHACASPCMRAPHRILCANTIPLPTPRLLPRRATTTSCATWSASFRARPGVRRVMTPGRRRP